MVISGTLKEGDVATDGHWMYEIRGGEPVRIVGVHAPYNWTTGVYGPANTNWDDEPQQGAQQ
jgi:hypothetical protein